MIYAVGDIHGKHTLLNSALNWIKNQYQPGDRIVFLGDYIDRGEDSKGVLDTVIALKAELPETICLRGNHEELILGSFGDLSLIQSMKGALSCGQELQIWINNGGMQTMWSYGEEVTLSKFKDACPQEHWDFMHSTLMEYEEGCYKFVHAGVVPSHVTGEMEYGRDPRLWIRDAFLHSKEDFGKIIVFGHTPQWNDDRLPRIEANKIGLDTGAVFGGALSVAALDPLSEGNSRLAFTLFQVEEEGKHGAPKRPRIRRMMGPAK